MPKYKLMDGYKANNTTISMWSLYPC